jgi:hypothetical protein
VAEQDPEQIAVPVVWVGVEETPILFSNQAICQFDQDLETFILTFGQLTPPAIIGTPEEMREQAEQISFVQVRVAARLSMSPAKLAEVHAAIGANLDQLEKARNIRPGDPR